MDILKGQRLTVIRTGESVRVKKATRVLDVENTTNYHPVVCVRHDGRTCTFNAHDLMESEMNWSGDDDGADAE